MNIIQHEDGTYTIEVPYLWTVGLDSEGEDSGFHWTYLNPVNLIYESEHSFTIINYPYLDIPVEKYWDSKIDANDMPKSIRVYLLNNGERVLDENDNFIFLDLTAESDWKGIFEKLTPISLTEGGANYSLEEAVTGYIVELGDKSNEAVSIVIRRLIYVEGIPTVYWDYSDKALDFNVNVYVNDELYTTGRIYDTGEESNFKVLIENLPLLLKNKPLKVEYVLQDDGKPYDRDLLEYNLRIVGNEVDGYTLYVPKITLPGSGVELLTADVLGYSGYYILTLKNSKDVPPPPPETPPENPPELPPESPPETPPETPEVPIEPPEIPPESPDEPKLPPVLPEPPFVGDKPVPKTGTETNYLSLLFLGLAVVGFIYGFKQEELN